MQNKENPIKKILNKIKALPLRTKVISICLTLALIVVAAVTVTVTVKLKNRPVSVIFDTVYGTEVSPITLKRGEAFVPDSSFPVPTRPGVVFTGWFYDKSAKKPYNGEPVKKTTTLYAGYAPIGYSVTETLGKLPADTSFTLFSTERIAQSLFADYISLSVLCGSDNTLTFTEITNMAESGSGYYYTVKPEKAFDPDGIYRLKLEKPVKAWLCSMNDRPFQASVSDTFTFEISPKPAPIINFTQAETTSEFFGDAAAAALVNAVIESVYSYVSANVHPGIMVDSLREIRPTAADFGIGPHRYITDKANGSGKFTFTGLKPFFTAEIIDQKPVIGFSFSGGTLTFQIASVSVEIEINLLAKDRYEITAETIESNGEYPSMSQDYRKETVKISSDSDLVVSVLLSYPGNDLETQTISFNPEIKDLAKYWTEMLPYVTDDGEASENTEDSNPASTNGTAAVPVLAKVSALFNTESGDFPFEANLELTLNGSAPSSSSAICRNTVEYFITNGLRSYGSDSEITDISCFDRPFYGKRVTNGKNILSASAASPVFTVYSDITLKNAVYPYFTAHTGIGSRFGLETKAFFSETAEAPESALLPICDCVTDLCKPEKTIDKAAATKDYLQPGEDSIRLYSHYLNLSDLFGGNGTRISASEGINNLPDASAVKILVKNADIAYYTIGAGLFDKPEKSADSLIKTTGGRIIINPLIGSATFDLVIRSKDTTVKDDSDDYSDARIIHVSFEPLTDRKPCTVALYDTENVMLFSGSFLSGDTISLDFDSAGNKARFLIYAHYQTSDYQPSTLAFYDSPMGTDGSPLSGLLSVTDDTNIYLSLMPNFSEITWYCRYGKDVETTPKAKTAFAYAGTSTEIIRPNVPELTVIPGDYDETELKVIGFTDNYTIIDGKYKRYTPVGYIEMNKSSVSYKVHVFVKYPDKEDPAEFTTLTGKYDADFVFPQDVLNDISKNCEIIGFCNGSAVPAGVTPETYTEWADGRNIFESPARDVSEVSYCALVRYRPGFVTNRLVNSDGTIVQEKNIYDSPHILVDALVKKSGELPRVEFTMFWNEQDSAYDIYRFAGYGTPESRTEDGGYTIASTVYGIYKYAGRTDVITLNFTSGENHSIVSRDLIENPEAAVIREQPDEHSYKIIGSSGYINGSEIRPSDVTFVVPALDIPDEYREILSYQWIDDKHPDILLSPDTEYPIGIVPPEGLDLHPVFGDIRVVELTVTDGVFTETVVVSGLKGTRLSEIIVTNAASAVNPAFSELSAEVPFPIYYFGSLDTDDSPLLIDKLEITFRHLLKQVRLRTGIGGPFEDNTILQIIEGEPDTPIKESSVKKIKESRTITENPPSIKGYTFLGFAESKDGEPKPISSFTYSNQDLYAIYSRYTKWGVTFNAGDGTFPDGSASKVVFVLDGSIPELPEAPSVPGKTFTGWVDATGTRINIEKKEIRSATTCYASYEYNTFMISLNIEKLSVVYDGKTHSPKILVSGLPAGYTCSVEADVSAKDVTPSKLMAGYKNFSVFDESGNDVTSRARVTAFYGSLEITPATLTVTTDSLTVSYVDEYSCVIGTGTCTGVIEGETVDFRPTGFIDFFNTGNPSLAEWQHAFFLEHGYVEATNTWQINWASSTAKQSNYTIVEKEIGTLRLAKRSTLTFKCNSAFLLTTVNVNEAHQILTEAAAAGRLATDAFTCSYTLDTGSRPTSFTFPEIWTYRPYFENDDTTFNTAYLKQLSGSSIRSVTIRRTSDGTIIKELAFDRIWDFVLDTDYTFIINLTGD